jgi:hypothetical protein
MTRKLTLALALMGATGALALLSACGQGGLPQGNPTTHHSTTTKSTPTDSTTDDSDDSIDLGTIHSGQNLAVTDSGTVDIECDGGGAIAIDDVSGITVFASGDCASVSISTDNNSVLLDTAGAITVSGNDNSVSVQSGTPTVKDTGSDNTITSSDIGTSDSPSPSDSGTSSPSTTTSTPTTGDAILVSTDGASPTIQCTPATTVTISADDVLATLVGRCAQLNVTGNQVIAALDSIDVITVSGDDAAITYGAGNPKITKTGANDIVMQG